MLQAHLKKKQNVENTRVNVPNCQERLHALANAAKHGAHFTATGGHHFTSDNVFCAAEIPIRKEQIKKMEKEKKDRSAGIACTEKVKESFETGKPITGMTVQELNALLKWFHEPNPTQGRVDKKRDCLIKYWTMEKQLQFFHHGQKGKN